jgi:hypothetical protein
MKAANELEAMISAGVAMSNVCFNGKQNQDVPKRYRHSMEEAQKKWDATLSAYREASKQNPTKKAGKK